MSSKRNRNGNDTRRSKRTSKVLPTKLEDLGDLPLTSIMSKLNIRCVNIKVIMYVSPRSDIGYGLGYVAMTSDTDNDILERILERVKMDFNNFHKSNNENKRLGVATSNVTHFSPDDNFLGLDSHTYMLNRISMWPDFYNSGGYRFLTSLVNNSLSIVSSMYNLFILSVSDPYQEEINNNMCLCRDYVVCTHDLEKLEYPDRRNLLSETSKHMRSLTDTSSFGKKQSKELKKLQKEARNRKIRITKDVRGKRVHLTVKELRKKLK